MASCRQYFFAPSFNANEKSFVMNWKKKAQYNRVRVRLDPCKRHGCAEEMQIMAEIHCQLSDTVLNKRLHLKLIVCKARKKTRETFLAIALCSAVGARSSERLIKIFSRLNSRMILETLFYFT